MMTLLIIRTLAQNYAKKCKNGTLSKIEIVGVRKKIFDLSFQFLKAKGHEKRICNGKYTSLNKKITRSSQS